MSSPENRSATTEAAEREVDGRRRVVIENVSPQVDGGRFPVKRVIGERLTVEADVFVDGHDRLRCLLLYRKEGESAWKETPMRFVVNDRWRGEFEVRELGFYRYAVVAWVDRFLSWRDDLAKRTQPDDIELALLTGAELVQAAAARASASTSSDAERLARWAELLGGKGDLEKRHAAGLDDELAILMERNADRRFVTRHPELAVVVDRKLARFSAWYEFFPRSVSNKPGRHGTFRDCEDRLRYVSKLGFDVVYLPPIHPIGRTKRKGGNNSLLPGPDDPGSPWAIGAREGGHKAVHPDLGTLEDFEVFVTKAKELGLEVALDIAFQCSPDHPYVKEHPEWFTWRPNKTVQYAENPPKKYEDIYPFNFETENWRELWDELLSVFLFWVDRGVKIFRVDNPHTKPFAFWEWALAEIEKLHPETIFLSEAFSRPKIMHRLAKIGFTQSYTYFTWRNTRWELTEYLTELTRTVASEYMQPNFWPNTPDILPEHLQLGGRPAFMARLVLAATLSSAYGIYGPAYELLENTSRQPGSEEYLDSEKYQLRQWDLERSDSLSGLIARLNTIRRENPALQENRSLRFHHVSNEEIICYSKTTDDFSNVIVTVVNLDPYHTQSGWVKLPLERVSIEGDRPYQVHDLLSDSRYLWHGTSNYVEVDPRSSPAHVFRIRRRVRTERDFDYFM